MGCGQSIPSEPSTTATTTTQSPPPPSAAAAAATVGTTAPTAQQPSTTPPSSTVTTTATATTTTATTKDPVSASSATEIFADNTTNITTNNNNENENKTTTTTSNTMTTPPTTASQQQQQQQQQRQPARNIFAKPILLPNAVTAATTAVTNTVATTVTTAHQHIQHQVQTITSAIGNMTTNTTMNNNKKLPYYEKTPEVTQFLLTALVKNFVFEHCTPQELQQLCDCMEPYTVPNNNHTVIIQQGAPIGDFFYIIHRGTVTYYVNDVAVGTATSGDQFGELSLLYSAPRAATVIATPNTTTTTSDASDSSDTTTTTTELYRMDQISFRTILQQQTTQHSNDYVNVLKRVKFLNGLDDYNIYKLSSVLQKQTYTKDTVIVQKGDTVHPNDVCYILVDGTVTCSDISINECHYENIVLSHMGDFFGERAILTGEPRAATVTATSDIVTCYTIDKITFDTVLGNYQSIITKVNEERLLSSIPLISSSKLTAPILQSMTQLVKEHSYPNGTTICQVKEICEPAIYIIRKGYVTKTTTTKGATSDASAATGGGETIGPGGYFGDDQLLFDIIKKEQQLPANTPYYPTYTVVAGRSSSNNNNNTTDVDGVSEDLGMVTVGVITLSSIRTIMDTQYIGKPAPSINDHKDSLMYDRNIALSKLQRHTVLGSGTFGMVYLVSRTNSIGDRVAYALKVQAKYELVKEGQAQAVICEKNIMAKLHHPFLIGLINTYQDETFVYLLLQLIQGGELYSYIHTKTHDHLTEGAARFYAACIGEGLGYMHKQGYVYRDLKPENVLVDQTGYCVIIDFGFAKYVPIPTKTFTLCGTPLYIAPEVILNRGHNSGADHWSLGILIFEMLYGTNPFYKHGMDQMDLFRGIVKSRFAYPTSSTISDESTSIVTQLLTRDPNQRLGSLAAGEDGILYHPWFTSFDMDMEELRNKKYTAPVIPKIKDPLDSSNFENWDHLGDKTKKKYPPISHEEHYMFENF